MKPQRVTITNEYRPDPTAVTRAIAALLRWSDEARSAQEVSPSVPVSSSDPDGTRRKDSFCTPR